MSSVKELCEQISEIVAWTGIYYSHNNSLILLLRATTKKNPVPNKRCWFGFISYTCIQFPIRFYNKAAVCKDSFNLSSLCKLMVGYSFQSDFLFALYSKNPAHLLHWKACAWKWFWWLLVTSPLFDCHNTQCLKIRKLFQVTFPSLPAHMYLATSLGHRIRGSFRL